MIWDDVLAFRAVCEELHYTRAATRLYTSQPTLSTRVKRLEREVGARLLNRTSRSVSITPEGEELLDWAREVHASWTDVRHRIGVLHEAGARSPHARTLAAAEVDLTDLLPLLDGGVGAPTLAYRTYGVDADVLTAVYDGSVALGLVTRCEHRRDTGTEGLRTTESTALPMWVYFPADHPAAALDVVDLGAFADHDWITGPGRSGMVHGICEGVGRFRPRIRHETGDARLAQRLVVAHRAVVLGSPGSWQQPGVTGRPFHRAPVTRLAVLSRTQVPVTLHRRVQRACDAHARRFRTGAPAPGEPSRPGT